MAITHETLRLVALMQARVDQLADGPTRSLTTAWIRAWDVLAVEFTRALDEVLQINAEQWPTRSQIERAPGVQYAVAMAQRALDRLVAQARDEIVAAAKAGIGLGVDAQGPLIASQLPPGAQIEFSTVPENQVSAVVNRAAQQIHAVTWPLAAEAVAAMKARLIRGMAMGGRAGAIVQRVLSLLEGEFNGGLARALNIARTEILDAYRAAGMLAQHANAAVFSGWQWISRLSVTTCPSCWSKHGNIYPITEPGPWDHQSGRCTRAPVLRSWRELGFNIPEPPSAVRDAQATFWALPRADQLQIMGLRRLDLLERGDISWADLSTRRTTPGWRPSFVVTPLRDLART